MQQYVLWLHVCVDDVKLVQVLKAFENLDDVSSELLLVFKLLMRFEQPLLQKPGIVAVLHEDGDCVLVLGIVDERDDVFVNQVFLDGALLTSLVQHLVVHQFGLVDALLDVFLKEKIG